MQLSGGQPREFSLRFGNERSFNRFNLSHGVRGAAESQGYREKPKEDPYDRYGHRRREGESTLNYLFKRSWNLLLIPLTLLSGTVCIQKIVAKADLSGHKPETIQLYESLNDQGNDFLLTEGGAAHAFKELVADSESFKKLDAQTQQELQARFSQKALEIKAVNTTISNDASANGPWIVGSMFGMFISLIVTMVRMDSRSDYSLAFLRELLRQPKKLKDRLGLKQFEIKPMSNDDEERVEAALKGAIAKIDEMHRLLEACAAERPEFNAYLTEAFGHVPTADELLLTFAESTLIHRVLETVPNQRLSKTKTLDLLKVTDALELSLDEGLQTGLFLQVMGEKDLQIIQTLSKKKDRDAVETKTLAMALKKKINGVIASQSLALFVIQKRLDAAAEKHAGLAAEQLRLVSEKTPAADQRLLVLKFQEQEAAKDVQLLSQQYQVNYARMGDLLQTYTQQLLQLQEGALGRTLSHNSGTALDGAMNMEHLVAELTEDSRTFQPDQIRLELEGEKLIQELGAAFDIPVNTKASSNQA